MTGLASAGNCCWVNISDDTVGQKAPPHTRFASMGKGVGGKTISHPFALTLAADTTQEGKQLPWGCSSILPPHSFIFPFARPPF